MYERYWKLDRAAFRGTHDSNGYYPSRTHQGALVKLRYLIEHRLGAGLFLGDHGLGKTYLTHVLEAELPEHFGPVARLVFPQMTPVELLAYLAAKLGAESPRFEESLRTDRVLQLLETRLAQLASEGRHPILMIDEAQVLTPQHFQILHLLLNLPAEANAHFSLLLIGDPDLLPKVQRVGALDDRIGVRTTLRNLTLEETEGYLAARLEYAGRGGESMFTDDAIRTLWEISQGVPRRINQLCDLSLLVGYADSLTSISHLEIEAAAEEFATVSVE
jgi:general secretion pathway protein A